MFVMPLGDFGAAVPQEFRNRLKATSTLNGQGSFQTRVVTATETCAPQQDQAVGS
jgi:hypothetical protein